MVTQQLNDEALRIHRRESVEKAIAELSEERQLKTYGYNSSSTRVRRSVMKFINYYNPDAYSEYSRMIALMEVERARLNTNASGSFSPNTRTDTLYSGRLESSV
jgi:hypothetical protein